MEPNVWRIAQHVICQYFKTIYWINCKYTLFNLFLHQYETINRKIDREFISKSTFGVYSLLCQLCDVTNKLNPTNDDEDEESSVLSKSAELRAQKGKNESVDDGFQLNKSQSDSIS